MPLAVHLEGCVRITLLYCCSGGTLLLSTGRSGALPSPQFGVVDTKEMNN